LDEQAWDLYYFATPAITTAGKRFDPNGFYNYFSYFVTSLDKLVGCLSPQRIAALFYASTVSIETRPEKMMEYAMAKACGEILCDYLRRSKNIPAYCPRFQRLRTNLTATVTRHFAEAPEGPVLQALREFYRHLGKSGGTGSCQIR